MGKVVEYLKGKKSYIVAAGIAIVVGLQTAGIIDEALASVILGFLGAGGLAAIAAKVDRGNAP